MAARVLTAGSLPARTCRPLVGEWEAFLSEPARPTPLRRLWTDESGATAIEYALMSCIMAVVVVALVASGLSPGSVLLKIAVVVEYLGDQSGAAKPVADGE